MLVLPLVTGLRRLLQFLLPCCWHDYLIDCRLVRQAAADLAQGNPCPRLALWRGKLVGNGPTSGGVSNCVANYQLQPHLLR